MKDCETCPFDRWRDRAPDSGCRCGAWNAGFAFPIGLPGDECPIETCASWAAKYRRLADRDSKSELLWSLARYLEERGIASMQGHFLDLIDREIERLEDGLPAVGDFMGCSEEVAQLAHQSYCEGDDSYPQTWENLCEGQQAGWQNAAANVAIHTLALIDEAMRGRR